MNSLIFSSFVVLAIVSISNAFQTQSMTQFRTKRRTTTLVTSSASADTTSTTSPIYHHHTAIRTRNIENAIKFYSLFGYDIETKFRAGPARAAWLTNSKSVEMKGQSDVSSRLELIEVPAYVLQEKEGTIKRALDLLTNESLLGLNHYALDVTSYIHSLGKDEYYGLDHFLADVSEKSEEMFGKELRVAMDPKQQVIGNQVFELCFLFDADGCAIELVRYIKDLEQDIQSGWEPWDGSGFVGTEENKS